MKSSIMKKFSFLDEKIVFKYMSEKHNFTKHIHDNTFMIGICIKGKSIFTIEDKTYDIDENEICIIPPKLSHFCIPSVHNKKWKFLNFHITKGLLQQIVNSINKKNVDFTFKSYFINDNQLSVHLKNIINNTLTKEIIDEKETLNFLSILLKSYAIFSKELKESKDEKFKPLFEYLKDQKYCLKHLDFYKMAEIMNMNPYYFHRTFSKTIGITPQAFINSLRLSKATQLLEKHDSLAQVALQCGFYDQAYFTKQFKKYYGITPTNYKKIS